MRTLVIAAAATLALTVAVAAGRPPVPVLAAPAPQLPTKFTNLQLLPKDSTTDQVVNLMKSFTTGLGVRCEFCHVGQGNDLTRFDFAADTKPEKVTARTMMKMMNTIAGDYLADVGKPSNMPKVTCYTCHRGDKKPMIAPPGSTGRG